MTIFELIKEIGPIPYRNQNIHLIHQAAQMEITENEYEAALKRIDELLPLVIDDTPDSGNPNEDILKISMFDKTNR